MCGGAHDALFDLPRSRWIYGLPGDLLLTVHILPHHRYRVHDHDLTVSMPIAPWEAALGTKIDVPTPDGAITLSIPPGSQSGQQLRVRGKGLPKKGDERGNLLVELKIVVPKRVEGEERALFEKLSQISSFRPRTSENS